MRSADHERMHRGGTNYRFGGELIFFGSERFPAWPDVVTYLRNTEHSRPATGATQ